MEKATLAVKLNPEVIKKAKKFCAEHGIKYGFFVEKALLEKLEEEELKEDLLDLKLLRKEEKFAASYEEYLKTRRA
jgi:predicted DNA binding CopG/RHH family protein